MSVNFWITLWTITWFVGLVVFTGLSCAIIVFGAKDLLHLLRSLAIRHEQQGETPPAGDAGK